MINGGERKAGPYIGGNSTSKFPFDFKIFKPSDMYVVRLDVFTNIETVLKLDSDYSVQMNASQDDSPGGTVILKSVLPAGFTLTLTSSIPYEQPTVLTNRGGFYPEVINDALDRATIQIQQVKEESGRALKVPLSATVDTDIPNPNPNCLLGWDADGKKIQNVDPGSLATIVAYATAFGDVVTGDGNTKSFKLSRPAGSLYNLDVTINGLTLEPTTDYSLLGDIVTFVEAPQKDDSVLIKYHECLPIHDGDSQDIRFVQADYKAVTRSVQSKLRDTVSVKDFGAVGNGTDATDAFVAAMATGKAVYAPSGTYLLNFVNVPSNTFLFGDGANTVIKPLTVDKRCALGADSGSASSYIENVTIRDIKFLGDVDSVGFSEQRHLTSFNGVKNLLVENCQFIGFRGDGLYLGSGNNGGDERHNLNVTIHSCFFDGINKDNRNGISIVDGDGVLIEGNYFTRTTRSNMPGAIDIEPDPAVFHVVRNITIRNNKFYDIGGNVGCIAMPLPGITYSVAPNSFIVENNYIDTCSSNGLHFSYAPTGGLGEATGNFAVRWTNNYVANARSALGIFGTKDHIIEGNSFIACPGAALIGYSTANQKQFDLTLKNNLFYKCGSASGNGLSIFHATRLTLDGNTFNDCGTGAGGSANAIDFNTGTSSYVSLLNNKFIAPTGKTLVAIQKEAGHTFTAETNRYIGNYTGSLPSYFQVYDSDTVNNSYTPILGGTDSDGAGTYTTQIGQFNKIGRVVNFNAKVVSTAHTGSGEIELSIPIACQPLGNDPWYFVCNGTVSNGTYNGIVTGYLATNADVNGQPSKNGGAIRFRTTTNGAITVAGAMTVNVSGMYYAAIKS